MALETLGAICAVGQLAGQCVYVLETIGKVRRSTETLKEYQTQLQGLRILCEVIRQNPLLQTTEIIAHTQSILKTTQQQDNLTLLLQKRRLSRVWAFLRVERRLLEHTKNVETLKSTLAISIQDQQCRILHDIDKRTQMPTMNQKAKRRHDDDKAPRGSADLRGDLGYGGPQPTGYANQEEPSEVPTEPERPSGMCPGPASQDFQTLLKDIRSAVGSKATVWLNNSAHEGVDQQNGITIEGVPKGNVIDARHQVWVGNNKRGPGHQLNGFNIRGNDGGRVPMLVIHGGVYHKNDAINDQNQIKATQTNGHQHGFGPGRRKQRKNRSRRYQ